MGYNIKKIERYAERKLLYYIKRRRWQNSSKSRAKVAGDYSLDRDQISEIEKIYDPFVKMKDYSDHKFYSYCTGEFHADYLPDWLYYSVIDPFYNNWDAARFVDNKCFYEILFPDCIQPYCLAFRINGLWFSHDREVITYEKVLEIINNEECAVFIKAAQESNGGHGVFRLFAENPTDYIDKISGDIVIQRELLQSQITAALNKSSVNTIRVISLLSKGGVKIYSRIVRFGASGSYVDNASSGGLTIGLSEDGKLNNHAYDKHGIRYEINPSTGKRFENIFIPNINLIDELVRKSHLLIPYFRMVSWDIALDINNNPVLIEANLKDGGLDIHQLNNGPLFGSDLLLILNEVYSK